MKIFPQKNLVTGKYIEGPTPLIDQGHVKEVMLIDHLVWMMVLMVLIIDLPYFCSGLKGIIYIISKTPQIHAMFSSYLMMIMMIIMVIIVIIMIIIMMMMVKTTLDQVDLCF